MMGLWFLGAVFTVTGTTGTALCILNRRKQQIYQLKRLAYGFELLAGEISYSRASLPEGLCRAGEKLEEPFSSFFINVSERLMEQEGSTFSVLWQEETQKLAEELSLEKSEKEQLLTFPDAVWFLDGSMQKEAAERFSQDFLKKAEDLELKEKEQRKMVLGLGIVTGLMTVVLLI